MCVCVDGSVRVSGVCSHSRTCIYVFSHTSLEMTTTSGSFFTDGAERTQSGDFPKSEALSKTTSIPNTQIVEVTKLSSSATMSRSELKCSMFTFSLPPSLCLSVSFSLTQCFPYTFSLSLPISSFSHPLRYPASESLLSGGSKATPSVDSPSKPERRKKGDEKVIISPVLEISPRSSPKTSPRTSPKNSRSHTSYRSSVRTEEVEYPNFAHFGPSVRSNNSRIPVSMEEVEYPNFSDLCYPARGDKSRIPVKMKEVEDPTISKYVDPTRVDKTRIPVRMEEVEDPNYSQYVDPTRSDAGRIPVRMEEVEYPHFSQLSDPSRSDAGRIPIRTEEVDYAGFSTGYVGIPKGGV